MAKQLKILVGIINKYPVTGGWANLTPEQQEQINDQGWYEDDFPVPKWEAFWQVGELMFSTEMDLMSLGIFAFDGWTHQYIVADEYFLTRFVDDGYALEAAKFIVEDV